MWSDSDDKTHNLPLLGLGQELYIEKHFLKNKIKLIKGHFKTFKFINWNTCGQ